jgi:hypothetical protein
MYWLDARLAAAAGVVAATIPLEISTMLVATAIRRVEKTREPT